MPSKTEPAPIFCPLLSMANMMKPGASLVSPDGKPQQPGILCIKNACGFWHQIAVEQPGDKVAIIEGCAIPHIADGLMAVQQSIHTVGAGVEMTTEVPPAKEKVQ